MSGRWLDSSHAVHRLHGAGAAKSIARAGRSGFLKSIVRALFKLDSLFSLLPFGPGPDSGGKKKIRAR